MAVQLLFNAILAIFFGYCYFYVGSTAPEPQPNSMDGAQWPQIILALLVICLIVNMIQIYRRTPKEARNMSALKGLVHLDAGKIKLLAGMGLLLLYAVLLPFTGFLLTSFLFAVAYSRLLGEKRPLQLLLYSFISVILLYFIFSKGLGIMLPRGEGFLRDFALLLETI